MKKYIIIGLVCGLAIVSTFNQVARFKKGHKPPTSDIAKRHHKDTVC